MKRVTEGKFNGRRLVTGRRGRNSKQLLSELKGKKGEWNLEAMDRNVFRTRFGKGCGPIVRQTAG